MNKINNSNDVSMSSISPTEAFIGPCTSYKCFRRSCPGPRSLYPRQQKQQQQQQQQQSTLCILAIVCIPQLSSTIPPHTPSDADRDRTYDTTQGGTMASRTVLLPLRRAAASAVRRQRGYSSTSAVAGGASPPLPPFARLPAPSEKVRRY